MPMLPRAALWLLMLLAPWAPAAAARAESRDLAAGETLTLAADLVLADGESLRAAGTEDKPCTIVGQGHQIRTVDGWTGRLTLTHCRLKGLGTGALRPEVHAIRAHAAGEAAVRIEHCTFDGCAGVSVFNGGRSTTAFRYNTVLANSLVPVSKDIGDSRACFLAEGDSPVPKFFQGNRVFKAHAEFRSPRWLIGGDTDRDGNLFIGHRVKITAGGDTSVIRGNYLHVLMPRDEQFPYWSQVSTVDPGGNLVEHNVIRDGEWVVQMFSGEVRYNVICDINDHNLMRNGSEGKVHHNIFHAGRPDHPPGSMFAFISVVYPLKEPGRGGGGGIEIYNNTFDGCGTFAPPGVEVCPGGFVASLRNNVFCNMRLEKVYKLPPAVVRFAWDETEAAAADRLGYADYNLFHNPAAAEPRNYTLTVAGKALRRDAGFALNDVPARGAADAQADPKFTGPLPKEFPFDDADIASGKVTVSQMLAHFRRLYTPGHGSPLIDAGDPADGPGTDIGAVGAGRPAAHDRFGRFGDRAADEPAKGAGAEKPGNGR